MDESMLFNGVLRSLLGGRRRSGRRALRYLTGHSGSLWTNPTTLLTAAGVAWGIYETLQAGAQGSAASAGAGAAPTAPLPVTGSNAVSPDTMRLLRLAISAAGADGTVTDDERKSIIEQARGAGVGELVEAEMSQPKPLREIVAGVTDANERATLYVLAFTVARGDEQPGGAERIYLAQLANLLGLDAAEAQRLERSAATSIDKQQ
jgi:uncharacterized membrane protein YebE (DUF533 family)